MLRQAAEAREQLVIGYVGNDGTVAERHGHAPSASRAASSRRTTSAATPHRTFAIHRITAVSRPVDPARGAP